MVANSVMAREEVKREVDPMAASWAVGTEREREEAGSGVDEGQEVALEVVGWAVVEKRA